jgi:3-deoxy-D-manno-octulosonic acid (KDO) 8-phosphate synthase
MAAGVAGVFMEGHDNPREAKSDSGNALESGGPGGGLKELLAMKKTLAEVHKTP